MDSQTEQVFLNAEVITEKDSDTELLADLAGYQVTKG